MLIRYLITIVVPLKIVLAILDIALLIGTITSFLDYVYDDFNFKTTISFLACFILVALAIVVIPSKEFLTSLL